MEKITGRIFIIQTREDINFLGFTDEEILDLIKPLYGKLDADEYRRVTIQLHVGKDPGISPAQSDRSTYLKV